MSALVLGKRSSCFFEDLHHHPASAAAATQSTTPSLSKKARIGSSPFRPSPASSARDVGGIPAVLRHLRSLFPDMDEQLLERVFEASGNDLDSAIRHLSELRLGSANNQLNINPKDGQEAEGSGIGSGSETEESRHAAEGAEWVEVLVKEMMSATNMDDARARAAVVLEAFEKAVAGRTTAVAAEPLQKVSSGDGAWQEKVEGLLRENEILKRAVAIQHERQKEFEDKCQELSQLKPLLSQYQEQLRTLEVNNYALSLHLRQAQQGSSIPGRFHPDVF